MRESLFKKLAKKMASGLLFIDDIATAGALTAADTLSDLLFAMIEFPEILIRNYVNSRAKLLLKHGASEEFVEEFLRQHQIKPFVGLAREDFNSLLESFVKKINFNKDITKPRIAKVRYFLDDAVTAVLIALGAHSLVEGAGASVSRSVLNKSLKTPKKVNNAANAAFAESETLTKPGTPRGPSKIKVKDISKSRVSLNTDFHISFNRHFWLILIQK